MSLILALIAPAALALQSTARLPLPPTSRQQSAQAPRAAPPPGSPSTRRCLEQPRAPLEGADRFACVDRINGRHALMTVNDDGYVIGTPNQLDVGTALAIFADTRLEPLWPQISAILGPDGTALRDENFAAAEAAWRRGRAPALTQNRGTMESMNDADARAVLDYTRELDLVGRNDEAIDLLARVMPQPANGRLGDERQYEYLSYSLRRAQNLYNNRRFDEAIAELERMETNELIYLDYRINATVNKAAYLVELGRHAEGLAAIDKALDHFRAGGGDAMRVDGSSRQFAWIRACALHHLGRRDEARTALWPLDRAPERQIAANAAIPTSSSIALRSAFCLDDDARLAEVLRLRNGAAYPWAFANILQANWNPTIAGQTETLRRALARLQSEGVEFPVRQLPDSFRAALAGWRPAALAVASDEAATGSR
jgi:hypothetical protein